MFEKSLIANSVIIPDDIKLKYYLTEDNENYGIEIMKEKQSGNESKHISNITQDKNEILNIIEKLISNFVTPLTLEYIIEDLQN